MKGDLGDVAKFAAPRPVIHIPDTVHTKKKKKKLPSQENTLQNYSLLFYLPWAKTATNHGLCPYKKWNCTYFRNRNYAGFCEPFFPISDLWICGMTPATRITTSN